MQYGRSLRARRGLAALLAGSLLLLAAPPGASAREEPKNLWTEWWKGVTDRGIKAEIPFAFVITLPAMIVVTPVWLIERGYARLTRKTKTRIADDPPGEG